MNIAADVRQRMGHRYFSDKIKGGMNRNDGISFFFEKANCFM